MTIVDIHCHTFNADDLPVKGFIERVVGHRRALVRVLGWTLDKVTQGMASGATEVLVLDRLIADGPDPHEADEEPLMVQLDAETIELLAELEAEHPVEVEQARQEAAEEHAEEGPIATADGSEGLVSLFGDLGRYVKWAGLFGQDRLALTRALIELYPEVDLFTPMLVDLLGLDDQPKTSVLQQLEIQEKISRLGILGHFDAQVLPFVGFDPRRSDALTLARQGIDDFGCVGVKLYPPMGFLPWRNADSPPLGMSAEQAADADQALGALYTWCCENDVPITAHSNPSNFAHQSFADHSSPARWAQVLGEWPDLHLNLGHFGWGGRDRRWPDEICEMMATYPGLYADIGNHELNDLADTIEEIERLYKGATTQTLRQRFMFGTDWFMVASHRDFEQFLKRVSSAYGARFPDDAARFMGGAALSFLGFDASTNGNNRRTRARYAEHGADPPSWLAAA